MFDTQLFSSCSYRVDGIHCTILAQNSATPTDKYLSRLTTKQFCFSFPSCLPSYLLFFSLSVQLCKDIYSSRTIMFGIIKFFSTSTLANGDFYDFLDYTVLYRFCFKFWLNLLINNAQSVLNHFMVSQFLLNVSHQFKWSRTSLIRRLYVSAIIRYTVLHITRASYLNSC